MGALHDTDMSAVLTPPLARIAPQPVPPRAEALFQALQDRHLPITPQLAMWLSAFEIAQVPAADGFWGKAYLRAADPLGLKGKMGNTKGWQRLFPVFVAAVVEPILRWAAVETGELPLAAHSPGPDQRSVDHAREGATRLETLVRRALEDEDTMGRAFWIGAGVALLGGYRKALIQPSAARARSHRRDDLKAPMLPDLALAQLVYDIEPVIEEDRRWKTANPMASLRSTRMRVGIRPREGGVTGVLHTRRERDIGDALASAFVVPKRIRTIKLVDEGFMIPHRPPYRRPDRDLLSLTISTPGVDQLSSGDVVRAAWVDATQRLRILLNNMSMGKSELGHGRCTIDGCVPAALSATSALPGKGLNAIRLSEGARTGGISACSLLPGMFDTRVPAMGEATDTVPMPQSAAQAVIAACAAQAHAPSGPSRRRADAGSDIRARTAPKPEDYARVSLLEIAPRTVQGDETVNLNWRQDRREMIRRYGFEASDNPHCATVLCPDVMREGAVFVLCSDTDPVPQEITVPGDEAPRDALARTIGALSAALVTFNLMAVLDG